MKKERIYEIGQRSNIIHKTTSENEVVIYEDHRTIINVLFHLCNKRRLTDSLDVIMFDNHDDFCTPDKNTIEKIIEFLKNPTKEELNQIVELNLRPLDDDWVKVEMELGLINNVFLFNSDESKVDFREEYETKKFGTKYLYNLGDVWDALEHPGLLNDPIKDDYESLWNDFGWEYKNGRFNFKKDRRQFVFDIDLECFTTRIMDKTIAIPEDIIIPKLTEYSIPSYHHYYNSQLFIKQLIKHNELVTIFFENRWCGGIRQAHKIFNMVDEVLFENELGA